MRLELVSAEIFEHARPPTSYEPFAAGLRQRGKQGWYSMVLLNKLFGRKESQTPRVRICVECGMPIAEHKSWCSIFRTQQEMAAAKEAKQSLSAASN